MTPQEEAHPVRLGVTCEGDRVLSASDLSELGPHPGNALASSVLCNRAISVAPYVASLTLENFPLPQKLRNFNAVIFDILTATAANLFLFV